MPKTTKEKLHAIPTNVITGFLGVGKTTAIRHLLEQKPTHERWAVLVNEFGEIGIDGSLFDTETSKQQDVFIREVPGGCMCCTAGLPMQMALSMLLSRARPHRLLIEPTGLGHPKEVIEVLTAEYNRDLLSLNATITLVDARKLSDPRYTEHDTFNQQLDIADVIVANKADRYAESDLETLTDYLKTRHGDQAKPIFSVSQGTLESEWLTGKSGYPISEVQSQAQIQSKDQLRPNLVDSQALPDEDVDEFNDQGFRTISNQGEGYFSRGWVFQPDILFDRQKLSSALLGIEAERLKGVFITSQGVIGFNKADDVLTEIYLDDCIDSRFELIADTPALLEGIEEQLVACVSA